MPTQIGYFETLKNAVGKVFTYLSTLTLTGTDGKTLTVEDNCTVGGKAVNPTLPAFLVTPSAEQSNIAVAADVTVAFGTEIYDQANNFAANVFTAPITGKYHFDFNIALQSTDDGALYYRIQLITSNRTYHFFYSMMGVSLDQDAASITGSVLADMDAGDTAYLSFRQGAGIQQTDIQAISFFSGHLVC